MASIIGKTIKGQTYYYLREVARVGGKPNVVSQRYLGKAADIEAAVAGATAMPDRTRHLGFGDLAAVWGMLERLRVAEIIDEVVGARRGDAQASVGTYIALATANRVVDPCSKRKFADWWKTTAGDRFVKLASGALDHRRFWEAMDAISEEQLAEIERRIVAHMVEAFSVDLSGLVLDMTNFATYIDSANDRAPIAQRGHAKQKRTDLRIVGLGLVVSTDGGIPLVSHAYPGNRPDVTQFAELVEALVARCGALSGDAAELTLVYDAGQNSETNQTLIEDSPLHFVGSLPPSDHPDLLAVPKDRYRAVDKARFAGLSAFETGKVVFGNERRIVVTHSQNLHTHQSRGFDQTLGKARRQLSELAGRLARGKTRKSREQVEAEIAQIIKPRWLSRVISTTLTGDNPAELRLTWRTKAEGPKGPRSRAVRQADPLHRQRQRHSLDRRDRGRLSLPGRNRGRFPPDERPEGRLVLADVPLDRPEDPCPRPLLRARIDGRPLDGPRGRPPRNTPQRARAARHPGRDPRDRAALPRRARAAASPAHAHRDGPHPATPLR